MLSRCFAGVGRSLILRRAYSQQWGSKSDHLILNIPAKSKIYRLGQGNSATPIFKDANWQVSEDQSWAVIGSSSGIKTELLRTLAGYARIYPNPPQPGGLFPFLASQSNRDASSAVSLVSFAHRQRSSGGAFTDYTARYGAVFEQDCVTLRESMFSGLIPQTDEFDIHLDRDKRREEIETTRQIFEMLVDKMKLGSLLDLPIVALSNGQTRRARIVRALLIRPELMLLDEPFTGLDAISREKVSSLLQMLHASRQPRVIMGLRSQDPIPDWITHLAYADEEMIIAGPKSDVLGSDFVKEKSQVSRVEAPVDLSVVGDPLVVMRNVNVGYGGSERKVLNNIDWTIRAGERWHLSGPNGSGKTTLLAVLMGDHPQSYTQRPPQSALELFGQPRYKIATINIQKKIGLVSPELHNSFPRLMTAWDAVSTGFNSDFVPRGPDVNGVMASEGSLSEEEVAKRVARIQSLFDALTPPTTVNRAEFPRRSFANLSPGEQGVVLLMRALVAHPSLVLLDELWSGMDGETIDVVRAYLRRPAEEGGAFEKNQACIVISHWEDEVPWRVSEGLKKFRLLDGRGESMQTAE